MSEKQLFTVSVKACLMSGGKLLLLKEPDTKEWELPGGRYDVGEEALSPRHILKRELIEELGTNLKITIKQPIVTWIRPRSMPLVFAVGYLCFLNGGTISLSVEHESMQWVDRESWRTLPLAPGYHQALDDFWKAYLQE